MCLKNICDGVGGQDESNGTPLDPPLFWLDNIFKHKKDGVRCNLNGKPVLHVASNAVQDGSQEDLEKFSNHELTNFSLCGATESRSTLSRNLLVKFCSV